MKTISQELSERLEVILSTEATQLLVENSRVVTFPTKTLVLLEGDVSSNLYFILKGIVRGYYLGEDGNDQTKCFSKENQFFSTEGLRKDGISSFSIECLEDCECIELPYKMMQKLLVVSPNIKDLFQRLYLEEVGNLEGHAKNLLMLNAEQRYLKFKQDYPSLEKRVALQYIASFIGIRPASLSRIRKMQN